MLGRYGHTFVLMVSWFIGSPPAAPTRHIDAEAVMKDARDKTLAESAYAFLLLIGFTFVSGLVYVVMRERGPDIALLAAIGAAAAYAIVLHLLMGFRDARAQKSEMFRRLNQGGSLPTRTSRRDSNQGERP